MTAWGVSLTEACQRMDRALREFRIRGVKTNIPFLENVVNHPRFQAGNTTTTFLDETPELLHFVRRKDRATRLLSYLGDVIVNGNPEVVGKKWPEEYTPENGVTENKSMLLLDVPFIQALAKGTGAGRIAPLGNLTTAGRCVPSLTNVGPSPR